MVSADVYDAFVPALMILGVAYMACTIFQVDEVFSISTANATFPHIVYILALFQGIRHPNLNICLIFFGFTVACLNLFLYCHFGKRTTDEYAGLANDLFDSNWFELPVQLQKYFPRMISNAHIPLAYNGLHLVYLNLETFLRVNFGDCVVTKNRFYYSTANNY